MATVIQHKPLDRRPLRLETLLQINVGVLVILGTSLLAMGQQNVVYALIAVVATITAIVVTDWKGRFRLSPDATTLAAIVACVVLVVQVIRNVEESQLLNVANILIYLQVILLFQEKRDRTYWSLMALSLLQVVVAAALNLGLIFGMFLGVYVLAAGTALMLFYAVREIRPFVQDRDVAEPQANGLMAPRSLDQAPANFIGSLTSEAGSQMINASLLKRLGRMILVTALGTIVAFFAIPRYSSSVWQGNRQDQVTTVGFTEEVRLDDIGRILESPEQVMRVEFTDLQGRPYKIDGEPYFRGTVLSDYRGKGVWKQDRHTRTIRPLNTQSSFDLANTILQRITLQPGSHSVLFNVAPCHPVDESPKDLMLNLFSGQLTLSDEDNQRRGSFRYTLGTTAFRNGWQRDLIPAASPTERYVMEETMSTWTQEQLRLNNPSVVAIADSVIAQQGLEQASMFERCKALESHFSRSGIYRYSLDVNQRRNRRLDPIEDFVRNHHTGHCEYFAGALTLMLHSQGIPARMVVGYKVDEFNPLGNYYIVRQLHAHAWVEAFLPVDEIPEDEFETNDLPEYGCWLRLEPTPDGVELAQDEAGLAMFTTIRDFVDYLQVLWDDYVLGLNTTRQQQAIYQPVIRGLNLIGDSLFGASAWQARADWWRSLAARAMTHRTLGIPSIIPALLVALAAMRLAVHWRKHLGQVASQWLARFVRHGPTPSDHRPQLEAYRRLETALAPFGLVRSPVQTAFEFAGMIEHRLTDLVPGQPAIDIPRRITEAYYRFRFGREQLSDEENRQLMAGVQQLESLFHAAAGSPGRSRTS